MSLCKPALHWLNVASSWSRAWCQLACLCKEKKSHWNNVDFFPRDDLFKWLVNDRVQFEMFQFSSAWDHLYGNYWDWDTRFFGTTLYWVNQPSKLADWHWVRLVPGQAEGDCKQNRKTCLGLCQDQVWKWKNKFKAQRLELGIKK